MKADYPVRMLCKALAVSPSGYYDWERRQSDPSPTKRHNAQLLVDIERVFLESRKTYGSLRIRKQLAIQGQRYGRNRIARLMRQKRLVGRPKRKYRVQTTDSNHPLPIAPNLLAERAAPQGPNQVWVADITYIHTGEGWLYLSGIMDLFSRRIVGWAMSPSIDEALVLASWNMAVAHRQPPAELLLHSDRGSQYASQGFRSALSAASARPSMSRKANCYDNCQMESFWSTLKLELVFRTRFQRRTDAAVALFDYIETFYNRKRLHSSLGYCSPVDFESKNI
jgi:transposase InsO family protein